MAVKMDNKIEVVKKKNNYFLPRILTTRHVGAEILYGLSQLLK